MQPIPDFDQLHTDAPEHNIPNTGLQRSPPRSAQDVRQSSSKPAQSQHRFLDKLRTLSEVRPIPWRPGQELPPEKSSESARVQQRGAVLLSTRGRISNPACSHCLNGNGRFKDCIVLDNWFQGACSTCIFTSKGNRCSLRNQTSGRVLSSRGEGYSADIFTFVGNADGRALRYHNDNPEALESIIRDAAENPKPVKKRKRKSAPAEPLAEPPLDGLLLKSLDVDTLLQAEIAREQGDPLAATNPKEKRQRRSMPNLSVAPTYEDAAEMSRYVIVSPQMYAHPQKQQDAPYRANSFQGFYAQRPIASIAQELYDDGLSSAGRRQSTSIIEGLPKGKQRQIYGLVSGLENGIQNLHTSLASLKSLMGMDLDDG